MVQYPVHSTCIHEIFLLDNVIVDQVQTWNQRLCLHTHIFRLRTSVKPRPLSAQCIQSKQC